jgi:predicted small lipoprotein YifL
VNVLLTFNVQRSYEASMKLRAPWLCLACLAAVSLAACEKQGPLERAAEEVDEAVKTVKDGRESTATKIDDALDEARAGAENAAEELKQE